MSFFSKQERVPKQQETAAQLQPVTPPEVHVHFSSSQGSQNSQAPSLVQNSQAPSLVQNSLSKEYSPKETEGMLAINIPQDNHQPFDPDYSHATKNFSFNIPDKTIHSDKSISNISYEGRKNLERQYPKSPMHNRSPKEESFRPREYSSGSPKENSSGKLQIPTTVQRFFDRTRKNNTTIISQGDPFIHSYNSIAFGIQRGPRPSVFEEQLSQETIVVPYKHNQIQKEMNFLVKENTPVNIRNSKHDVLSLYFISASMDMKKIVINKQMEEKNVQYVKKLMDCLFGLTHSEEFLYSNDIIATKMYNIYGCQILHSIKDQNAQVRMLYFIWQNYPSVYSKIPVEVKSAIFQKVPPHLQYMTNNIMNNSTGKPSSAQPLETEESQQNIQAFNEYLLRAKKINLAFLQDDLFVTKVLEFLFKHNAINQIFNFIQCGFMAQHLNIASNFFEILLAHSQTLMQMGLPQQIIEILLQTFTHKWKMVLFNHGIIEQHKAVQKIIDLWIPTPSLILIEKIPINLKEMRSIIKFIQKKLDKQKYSAFVKRELFIFTQICKKKKKWKTSEREDCMNFSFFIQSLDLSDPSVLSEQEEPIQLEIVINTKEEILRINYLLETETLNPYFYSNKDIKEQVYTLSPERFFPIMSKQIENEQKIVYRIFDRTKSWFKIFYGNLQVPKYLIFLLSIITNVFIIIDSEQHEHNTACTNSSFFTVIQVLQYLQLSISSLMFVFNIYFIILQFIQNKYYKSMENIKTFLTYQKKIIISTIIPYVIHITITTLSITIDQQITSLELFVIFFISSTIQKMTYNIFYKFHQIIILLFFISIIFNTFVIIDKFSSSPYMLCNIEQRKILECLGDIYTESISGSVANLFGASYQNTYQFFIRQFFSFFNIIIWGVVTAILFDSLNRSNQQDAKIKEKIESNCVICKIPQHQLMIFYQQSKSFEQHQKVAHNPIHYLQLFIYLNNQKKKKDRLLTSIDQVLVPQIEQNQITFLPNYFRFMK